MRNVILGFRDLRCLGYRGTGVCVTGELWAVDPVIVVFNKDLEVEIILSSYFRYLQWVVQKHLLISLSSQPRSIYVYYHT